MTKRMLVDATHPEETRVAIVDDRRLEDFDFESTGKKQLKGNIYLAKVIRIEPSLQAAFVEYGGNRHGFLPFTEIHPDYFRIPVADRPHDEPHDVAGEDDDEDSGLSDQEVQAYEAELAHEREHSHNADPGTHQDGEGDDQYHPQSAESIPEGMAREMVTADISVAGDVRMETDESLTGESIANLGPEQGSELGLITDFGNAAIGEAAFIPTPIEVVGGEVAEVEVEQERIRRPRQPRYKIQEVVKRRQIMLIQVVKEERGNKGAALTTFLSLAGRYCVLMPNTDRGGGVSRKITSHTDRRRMKEILDQLETPEGMAVILRTAGMEQEPAEIQRDLEHLLRLWNNIREQTLQSTAPTLIYEEANLIKRSMRDLYSAGVAEILVAGHKGYHLAHDFMRSIMPEDLGKVKLYEDPVPLFFRYNVEKQIDQLYNPTVQLRSGGYIVINPTEALVSIDVNSGRSTRERHIEGTALKTNIEAAEEVARQLRLRDLAGLIVIDFIDMEDGRNNAAVERRMKEAMKADRARLQIGRISPFGLMELSRQRLHPSLTEINFERCPHCAGVGMVRSVDSSAISILRMIEEEGIRQPGGEMVVHVPTTVALYILNQKRSTLHEIERRYNLQVLLHSDDTLVPPDCKMERARSKDGERMTRAPAVDSDQILANIDGDHEDLPSDSAFPIPRPTQESAERSSERGGERGGERSSERGSERGGRRRGRYGRGGRDRNGRGRDASADENTGNVAVSDDIADDNIGNAVPPEMNQIDDNIGNGDNPRESRSEGQRQEGGRQEGGQQDVGRQGGRRRGRRGGRGRSRNGTGDRAERGDRPQESTEEGDRGERLPSYDRGQPPRAVAMPMEPIPVSIHDIDTTPRDRAPRESAPREHSPRDHAPREYAAQQTRSAPSSAVTASSFAAPANVSARTLAAAPPPSPYEVTNESPDKPKGGWWRKITGQ
jgi:ribonuclease E